MENFGFDLEALGNILVQVVSQWGLKLIGALVLLFLGKVAARWVARGVVTALEKGKMDATLVPFVSGLAYWGVMGMVLAAVFPMVGIQAASLVAVFGAAGLAVGLALQGTLSNFAAGVMLLVFRPFKVGDWVEVGGQGGSVKAIGLFVTTMATGDNVQILMPNSSVWGGNIKNFGAYENRRIDLVVGVSYDDDIDLAIKTVNEVLAAEPRVLDEPVPTVACMELGDSSVNLVVRPWVKASEYWPTRWDLIKAIKESIEAAGCSFPYPQRDVHVSGMEVK